MTALFVLEGEDGRKFVQWVVRIEAEGTIGDAMQELPQGKPFQGIPWDKLTTGTRIDVPDEDGA
jgi:hypothetical protein